MKKILILLAFVTTLSLSSCDQLPSPNVSPSGSITYNVNFDSNGGTTVDSQSVNEGDKVIKPTDPTRNGYSFVCWTYENSEWNFDSPVTCDMTLLASWEIAVYQISYELDGGVNHIDNPSTYTINDSITLGNPTKDGYTFTDWTVNDEVITSIDEGTFGNLIIVANWTINSYDLIVSSVDETVGSVSGGGLFEYNSVVSVNATPNNGYKFTGWYENGELVNTDNPYTFTMPSRECRLNAYWACEVYNIGYNLDGGSYPQGKTNPSTYTVNDSIELVIPNKYDYQFMGWMVNNDTSKIIFNIEEGTYGHMLLTATWEKAPNLHLISDETKGSVNGEGSYGANTDVTISAIANDGYEFIGWYEGETLLSSDNPYTFKMPNMDITYEAKWSAINYKITYNLDEGTNHPDNPDTYTYESSTIELLEPTKDGYVFSGWWDVKNHEYITQIVHNSFGDITIEAHWILDEYTVYVFSSDSSKGDVDGENHYAVGDEVVLIALAYDGCVFKGWYQGDEKVCAKSRYSFIMPDSHTDLTFFALFWTDEEVNINYAMTPTLSSDGKTITYGLYPQTILDDTPTILALESLIQKFDPDINGWYSYKGNYYAKMLASPAADDKKFSNGWSIVEGYNYWIKCEPIKWKVLEVKNNVYSLISNEIVDAIQYDTADRTYKYSDIRFWLNDEFYNSAFAFSSSHIQMTQIKDTYSDYIYLLTKGQMNDNEYLNNASKRIAKTNDYSRGVGSSSGVETDNYTNGDYWTRSEYQIYSSRVHCVNKDGNYFGGSVKSIHYGVRPAMKIKID